MIYVRPPRRPRDAQPDFFMQTPKQEEILRRVLRAADDGAFITFNRLHKSMSYECSRSAFKSSLAALKKHGLIEMVYGPNHVKEHQNRLQAFVKPTAQCYRMFRPYKDTDAFPE